jgi:hydrogenase-1 operon protein HyaF
MAENSTSSIAMRTGMVQSLLHEIALHLSRLEGSGEENAIDLRSLPMTQAERDELDKFLGHGDVDVHLNAAGESEIWETRYAGVWWVRHCSGDGRIAAETIEITRIPKILITHASDISAAANRLWGQLAAGPETHSQREP